MQKIQTGAKIPAYKVTVNTAAFLCKKSYLKQRLHKQYLHQYWKKFKMDQKKIVPNCEDRLSELTTSQIDRIIDNQKLQNLLYNNKQKIEPIQFLPDKLQPNKHSNIYQANFIAKINQIAIKRDIHFIPLEGMDDDHNKKIDKDQQIKSKKKPFKYVKEYHRDVNGKKTKTETNKEDDDVKSIQSFQGNLQEFQIKLDIIKQSQLFKKQNAGISKIRKSFKLIPQNRWFYGMSTIFFNQKKKQNQSKLKQTWKHSYDIQSENFKRAIAKPKRSVHTVRAQHSQSSYSRKQSQPFGKYKSNRIVEI